MQLGCANRIVPAGLGLLALGLAVLLAAPVFAQVETVPIRFSRPFEPVLSTNLNALVTEDPSKSIRDILRETDARGASGLFRDDPFAGARPSPARPRVSPAVAQRYREVAERRKNWVFTIEEDLENDPKVSQLLKFLDADSSASGEQSFDSMLNFYDRLERERLAMGSGTSGEGDEQGLSVSGLGIGPTEASLPNTTAPFGAPAGTLRSDVSGAALGRPRDPLNLGARRDPLITASTRTGGGADSASRPPISDGFAGAAQRARFEAFKGLFDSRPASMASASQPAAPALPLAGGLVGGKSGPATAGLGLPGLGTGTSQRFDSVPPGWSPPPPPTSPRSGYNAPNNTPPLRSTTPFQSVPTRRQ